MPSRRVVQFEPASRRPAINTCGGSGPRAVGGRRRPTRSSGRSSNAARPGTMRGHRERATPTHRRAAQTPPAPSLSARRGLQGPSGHARLHPPGSVRSTLEICDALGPGANTLKGVRLSIGIRDERTTRPWPAARGWSGQAACRPRSFGARCLSGCQNGERVAWSGGTQLL